MTTVIRILFVRRILLLLVITSYQEYYSWFFVQGFDDPLLSIMSLTTPPSSFYHTVESVDKYMELADGFNGLELIEKLTKFINDKDENENESSSSNIKKGRILEIGSGPGVDYSILSEKMFPNYEVVGSDYSLEFLKRLRQKYPKGIFLHLNASTMDTPTFGSSSTSSASNTESTTGNSCLAAGDIGGYYDIIYSNKVLHHLTKDELKTSLMKQSELLTPTTGIVSHSFWKGEGTEEYDGMFVQNYTLEELREIFESIEHYDILVIELYKEFEDNDSIHVIAKHKST